MVLVLACVMEASEIEMENKKFELLKVVTKPQRGPIATPYQRSSIKIALVSCECLDAGKPIDLGFDQIFENFECAGQPDGGIVRNVVRWSMRRLLECALSAVRWWNKPVGSHVGNVSRTKKQGTTLSEFSHPISSHPLAVKAIGRRASVPI
ncbi:plastid-lipid associated protein PAP / fibrillinfamily protein [Striga asiatica]|uniref:Plastid-lipid associated protein PAP / fibrillinfamily protein n=1 Tax=Striga asiatica TaxID=4170 RepID=A0A5A7PGA0_STRAF|nr:plastid-lipid associated protein PAP / fibrillinfamily protein [Striga asiatica]